MKKSYVRSSLICMLALATFSSSAFGLTQAEVEALAAQSEVETSQTAAQKRQAIRDAIQELLRLQSEVSAIEGSLSANAQLRNVSILISAATAGLGLWTYHTLARRGGLGDLMFGIMGVGAATVATGAGVATAGYSHYRVLVNRSNLQPLRESLAQAEANLNAQLEKLN